jgi:hypothetical protein
MKITKLVPWLANCQFFMSFDAITEEHDRFQVGFGTAFGRAFDTYKTLQEAKESLGLLMLYSICGGKRELYDRITQSTEAKSTVCGRLFKKGDGVYRCSDCGFDDTCVMCVDCFVLANHEGHDYSFHYTLTGSGCCDCGDKEAWKIPLLCDIHKEHTAEPDIEPGDYNLIKDAITEILHEISNVLILSSSERYLEQTYESIQKRYSGDASYSLLVWNDEDHVYEDVVSICVDTLDCSRELGKQYAKIIDEVVI